MKFGYLSAAALAMGLFAAQPVLAQSLSHDTPAKTTTTHTHKSSTHKSHSKKKKSSTATPAASDADTTKTQ